MKRIRIISMLTLALALMGAAPAQAQQQEQAAFKPHWYVQPQAGNSWTTGEASLGKLLSPAAQLSLGRQFSPVFGLRLGASGWQGRNWQVTPAEEYKWKHVQASLDATLSLTNLLGGYSPARQWNAYAFLGGGLNIAYDNDGANRLAAGHPIEFSKVWDGTYNSPALRGGLGVEYALSEGVSLGLEANVNMLPDKWNSKHGSEADWQNHLLLGVRIALGKTSESTTVKQPILPVAEEQTAEEEKTVVDELPVAEEKTVVDELPVAEEKTVVDELPLVEEKTVAEEKTVKKEKSVKEPKYEVKIYFAFNSSRISLNEAKKVRQLSRYMRSHRRSRVTISGYASPEGPRHYNKALSGWRADAVKQCLISYGVGASRITTKAKGEINLGNVRESRSAICIKIE